MSTIPRVSIGLPVYNGERYLAAALDCFLAQTFTDFELIVADNASTDRVGEIAQDYAARDARIRYHRNERNIGLSGNFNRVFELARGPYFKWAPADDVCLPTYLERCVAALDADPSVVLAYPATQFINAEDQPLDIQDPGFHLVSDAAAERLRYVLESEHWVNAVIGLIRADALRKTRMLPAYYGGDYRLLSQLALLGKFQEIPERLMLRRIHPRSSSQFGANGATPDQGFLAKYMKGDNARTSLPFCSLSFDQFRIVLSSSLSASEKMSLFRLLFRRLRWGRDRAWNELLTVGGSAIVRAFAVKSALKLADVERH